MTERRARGTSPAGRGDRRPSRSAKSRTGGKRADAARGTTSESRSGSGAAKSPRGRTTSRTTAGQRAVARRQKAKAGRSDHKILGLSTGRAVLLAAVLCGLALTLAVPLRTYFAQRAEATQLASQRAQLEEDVAKLRDRRAQQQDPSYIKAEAKDRLRLVMPGETPYIVQVAGIEQPAVPIPAAKTREPDPWYTELWRSISSPQAAAAQPDPAQPAPATVPTEEGKPR
ncbi:septum formation initiator family protein [Nocardia yamanashiensis]|uniref:septum formation initiator family protein n=1 Tax=Nocardia yamanashiensis TaxID=209247 RepID=UPI001E53A0DE|nr:septum formation initiator family protein [Nocardia yamanashiensis]UGT38866.1 septum formation initiator family protein [Nocardia yamanashiensis]